MLSQEYRCNPFVQVVLYGEGLHFDLVRVEYSADGPVAGPDSLVSGLVSNSVSGGDA
jgi:hypothetical protein